MLQEDEWNAETLLARMSLHQSLIATALSHLFFPPKYQEWAASLRSFVVRKSLTKVWSDRRIRRLLHATLQTEIYYSNDDALYIYIIVIM